VWAHVCVAEWVESLANQTPRPCLCCMTEVCYVARVALMGCALAHLAPALGSVCGLRFSI